MKFSELQDLERQVNIPDLLDFFGIDYIDTGETIRILCPLHAGDNVTSGGFYVDTNFYRCFADSCTDHTTIPLVDFLQKYLNKSFPQAITWLQKYLGKNLDSNFKRSDDADTGMISYQVPKAPTYEVSIDKKYHKFFQMADSGDIPYLRNRGFTRSTIKYFEIKYRDNFWLKNRIVFPIKDHLGKIVAYSGRHIDDDKIGEIDEDGYVISKYRNAPSKIHKKNFIYNLHNVKHMDYIILVEGFPATWRLHQLGFPAGAIMGSSVSEEQAYLLIKHFFKKKIYLCFDGDYAGQNCLKKSYSFLSRYAKKNTIKKCYLPSGIDPDDLKSKKEVIRHILIA